MKNLLKKKSFNKFGNQFAKTFKSNNFLLFTKSYTNTPPINQALDYQRPLVVIALGGNALLKRGDEMTAEAQRKNIIIACQKIGEVVPSSDVVLTHGNGPQVGLLAQQSSSSSFPMPLDVIGAESVGMIGYLIEQEFRNVVKGKEIVTIVTQIEVDPKDPAFLKPTKPIGRRYSKSEKDSLKNDWSWGVDEAIVNGQKEEMFRRMVASPEPKDILEIKAIRKLIEADSVVITCGGGGIPVMKNPDGSVHGVEAVIDKDKAGALLATSLNADALIMLTDVEFVYLDWKDPQKRRAVKNITPEELSQYSFADGTMGPKVFAAAEFVRKGGKWAAIGSLEKLTEIMEGTSGTRVIESEQRKNAIYLPYDISSLPTSWPPKWEENDISSWLNKVVELPEFYIGVLKNKGNLKDAAKFLEMSQSEFEKIGIPWSLSQALHSSISSVRKQIKTGRKDIGLRYVASSPYPWPFNGKLDRDNTAILVVDMQEDFCGQNGYFAKMGYPIELTRAPIPFIQNILSVGRKKGMHIIHTREGHRNNLVDLAENKRWRSERINAGIGSDLDVLIRGKPGWEIIQECQPIEGETIIDKPGKGAFYGTDLEHILRLRRIQNIILTGVTTDVAVHNTMREANDRGFECILSEDGTAAASKSNHRSAITMIHMSGGIFGATASTAKILNALNRLPDFN
eukprot:TRINITY_DN174_c0_g1_i1.p1 TRINITY_DN174_c0_g1~~TRINITY_DN174_c0_g1_i1.p1  ORF type:complete len:681 (-),score=219.17 TRINITY_DN174_c0_g1_i1:53-2095(-)